MSWQDLPASLDGITLSHRMRPGRDPILMLHGIGPGTTGRTNFGPLLDRLAPRFGLHLIDLAGFGASGRKRVPPFFDVPFWLRQIGGAIDQIVALHQRPPLLVGNSVGGALALKIAARRPELRQLLAIAAPAASNVSAVLSSFWQAPCDVGALAAAMRPMTASQVEPATALVAERFAPFQTPGYADYFDAMLADPVSCLAELMLTPLEAADIAARVTLVHGRKDRACTADATMNALLPMLPDADLILLGDCGHNVIAERCADVLATIERLEKVELS